MSTVNSKLTNSEQEVLGMLAEDFLTPKQITIRRQTTRAATYKIIKKLKKKGAYTLGIQMVDKSRLAIQPVNQIRIHAQQFSIKILWKDNKYKQLLEKANQINIDGNTVTLWSNSIDVYVNQSFYGDDVQHTIGKSMVYWNHFTAKLEHEVNCILKKPRSQNIKMVRCHYAETNNEFAKDIDNKNERFLKVYTKDDGKLWFLIDNSFNLHEAEAVHSKTGKEDMEKVKDVFNDIRDKDFYLPSDTKQLVDGLVKASLNLVEANTNIHENLNSQLKLLEIQTRSTAALAQNIESHIPSWMSNVKIEQELKKLRRII